MYNSTPTSFRIKVPSARALQQAILAHCLKAEATELLGVQQRLQDWSCSWWLPSRPPWPMAQQKVEPAIWGFGDIHMLDPCSASWLRQSALRGILEKDATQPEGVSVAIRM
mmetsp:Transcript_22092/g.43057  ORF Transcript_22092/g.43057 Transcript_22092/m.43057 type:complete len:111 (+) Transcript_22092:119-451(+)